MKRMSCPVYCTVCHDNLFRVFKEENTGPILRRIVTMRAKLPIFVMTVILLIGLTFAPLALQALAQNTSTTTTQSSPATQSNTTRNTAQTTTTTTQTNRPVQTTQTESTTVNPVWIVVGAVALLALLLIVILSMRGRSRSGSDTVIESKTTVKKE